MTTVNTAPKNETAIKKTDVDASVTVNVTDDKKATDNVLELAKRAKKAETPNGKLAATFQALKAAHDAEKTIKGIETTFWKASEKAADFGGVTVRFTDEEVKGVDKAILHTIRRAIKAAGLSANTMTIRKGGSFCIYGK